MQKGIKEMEGKTKEVIAERISKGILQIPTRIKLGEYNSIEDHFFFFNDLLVMGQFLFLSYFCNTILSALCFQTAGRV